MEFTVLASGSSGNAYQLREGDASLLLECGLPIKALRQALGFGLSALDGCLITHSHMDHAKAARDMLKAGVDVYASTGTLAALGLLGQHHRAHAVPSVGVFDLGPWRVTTFQAEHDAEDAVCFVVDHMGTGERLFYSGDTAYIRPRIAEMTVIAVECNNSWEGVRAGSAPESLKARVVATHMSLDTVKGFLRANDLSRVAVIWLLHLSDQHSDAERFRREIQELTGKETHVA